MMKIKYILFSFYLCLISYLLLSCRNIRTSVEDIEAITFTSQYPVVTQAGINFFGNKFNIIRIDSLIILEIPTLIEEPVSGNLKGIDYQAKIGVNFTSVTYQYFVFKEKDTYGITVGQEKKIVRFSVDSLYKSEFIHVGNFKSFTKDLGVASKIIVDKKTGKVVKEEFRANHKSKEDPDSIYRYYDGGLINSPFTFSHELDVNKQSKLCKVAFIYNAVPKVENNKPFNIPRRELFCEIKRAIITNKDTLLKIGILYGKESKKFDLR